MCLTLTVFQSWTVTLIYGDLKKIKVDGIEMWCTSAKTYILRVCEKIETLMGWKLRTFTSPERPNYHPELDVSDLLDLDGVSKYRMLIGSMNWVVILGRFDVCFTTQNFARYSAVPREEQMNALERVFGYLKAYAKFSIIYDARMPDVSAYYISKYDWFRSYPDAKEELPPDMPAPRGNPVRILGFFDASHASCLQTRRSVTGVLMFVNRTPIMWYSKRQATVETSTYGSELVAGRIACELGIDLRYRLRMLGVPVLGSCLMFGDNQSMVTNVTVPGSPLKKRSLAIAYHRVRECIAAGIVDIVHCPTEYNLADLMTKSLGPQVFQRLTHNIAFPPSSTTLLKNGELNETTKKTSQKTRQDSVKLNRLRLDYSRYGDGTFCPVRDVAEALSDDLFFHYLAKSHME